VAEIPKEEKKKGISFKLFLNIAFSILILFCLFKFAKLDIKALIEQIQATNLFWFSLTFIAFFAQIFTNAYRWNVLTKLIKYEADYFQSLHWYFQGAFSNSFLPTNFGGDALRAYKLGKSDKDWIRAASTVLVERLTGFIMMFALLPVGLTFLHLYNNFASNDKFSFVPQNLIFALWGVFVVMILGILSFKLWSRIPLRVVQKVRFAVKEYTKCHKSLSKVVIWTLITHMFLLLGNAFAAHAIGVPFSEIPIWYWLLLTPAATLAGFIIPAVKGLGAKEASYVYFLGLIGISGEQGLAIALIVFAATLLASLPGVSVVFQDVFAKKVISSN